jgi:hypothetical protein
MVGGSSPQQRPLQFLRSIFYEIFRCESSGQNPTINYLSRYFLLTVPVPVTGHPEARARARTGSDGKPTEMQ